MDDLLWGIESAKTFEPVRVAWSYAWATHWMLRAAEAATVKAKHVSLNWKKREVRLFIPKSKTGQQAKGAWRTLQCCGAKQCDVTCPWDLAVRALSCLKNNESPLFPTYKGAQVSKEQLARAWQNNLNPRMSGHSARRSGAMMYTRKGLGIYDTSFLGRWKSSAVLRYIEDALEEMPLNRAMVVARETLPAQVGSTEPKTEKKRKKADSKDEAKFEAEPQVVRSTLEPPIDKSQLFAVSTSARGKTRRLRMPDRGFL